MPGFTKEDIEAIFALHQATAGQAAAMGEVRVTARAFALALLQLMPPCPEQTLAIRHLQQAMMIANAGIVIHG